MKKVTTKALTGWGTPGAPVLPATVRAALAGQPVDAWIAPELGVKPGAAFEDLDQGPWQTGMHWSARTENYLVAVLRKALPHLRDHRVLARPLSPDLDLASVPWRSRTRNALAQAGLLDDRAHLSQATYAELLDLPGMGWASVLDFASTTDSYLEPAPASAVAEIRELAERVLSQWWADQVTGDDPRFSDLLPHRTSAAQQVELLDMGRHDATTPGAAAALQQLPALERTVEQVIGETLDESLVHYVCALLPQQDDRQTRALVARMGWDGTPPITLEAAGAKMGATRERVRQLQARLYKRRSTIPLFMPALDRALQLLGTAAPLTAEAAGMLLQNEGISRFPFHPASVLTAADYCGRVATFEIQNLSGTEMVISSRHLGLAQRLTQIALRQAGRYGISNLDEVAAEAAANDLEAPKAELRTYLQASPRCAFLDDDWFWSPTISNERNRLHNTSRGILSVVSPMDVTTLREGVRRRYHWRHLQLVAPRVILLKFYEAHPDFLVDEHLIRPRVPLDYRRELGPSEQVMVDVLRATPTGVLDRASLMDACIGRGLNPSTVSVMLTYSSVITHIDTDAWALRGVEVSPMAVKALLDANAQRPRQRRMLSYGWTPTGELWLAYRIPTPHSLVIGIPRAIGRYVAGRTFQAVAEDGTPTGTVVVDDALSSWGYSPFLSRRGGDDGDVLRITFDLMGDMATLALESADVLDDDEAAEAIPV